MQTSQHLTSARRTSTSWLLLATALVALGALTLIALQHGALSSLGATPFWAWPSIATGTAVGGVALAWLALARFAREAEQRPYVWTAPLLTIFCFAPLSQLDVAPPLPGVPIAAYLLGAATLIVGGGALGRGPSLGARAVAALLTLTPTLTLVLGHVVQSGTPRGALSHVDVSGLWLLGMSLFAGLGVLAIAMVGRGLEQLSAQAQAGVAAADAERLTALVHHAEAQWNACQHELARLAEERQLFEAWMHDQRADLAQRLQRGSLAPAPSVPVVSHEPAAAAKPHAGASTRSVTDDTQQFMALARPGFTWMTKLALVLMVLGAATAGAYFGWYRPMLAREQAAARVAREAAAAQAADVAALKAKLAAEQDRAEHALQVEQAKAEAARVETERAAAEAAALAAAAAEAEQAAASAAASASTERRAARASSKRAKKRSAKSRVARSASEDDPIAGLDGI